MSFMDQAMEAYRAPTADDLQIALPPMREPKKETPAEESRDVGQHGGAAEASPAATEAANTAEPEPQRDEPDDGEHTDSTEEQVAARAQRYAEENAERVEESDPVESTAEEAQTDIIPEVEPDPTPAPKAKSKGAEPTKLPDIEGVRPRSFKRVGFSTGEKTELQTVTRFPQPAIDRLRMLLAASTGGEFADAISSGALLTAFVMARAGVELDVDENTAVAAEVFRESDPRLQVVEDKLDRTMESIDLISGMVKGVIKRGNKTGAIAEDMEFAMAYLVADRVAGITTPETNETNVDVAHRKVLVARETIKTRAKAQRTAEDERERRTV